MDATRKRQNSGTPSLLDYFEFEGDVHWDPSLEAAGQSPEVRPYSERPMWLFDIQHRAPQTAEA